ncbi:MAG: hypothetical protein ACLGHP_09670 [Vicinamibacteria bacterium]
MAAPLKAITADELAATAAALSGRPCSARRVRYLLVTGGLGTELPRRRQGQTRLFGALDLALVRLALELEKQGASPWLIRVAMTYLRDDLVRAWKSAAPLALALRGIQGSLEPALKARPPWATVWVPLREIWRGLDGEVDKVCGRRDHVWMWRPVPPRDVPRSSA